VLVPEKLAVELQVKTGTPALKVVRHCVYFAGEPFEISIKTYRADRFTFSIKLRRERQ
jgi:DNA-binding GntR family transcriptional regulator